MLLAGRLHEQPDQVHPLGRGRARLVEQDRVGLHDPVDVVDHLALGGGGRRGRLPELALGGPDLVGVAVDMDVVVDHFGAGLRAQEAVMDEREVAHVEEVLDRSGRGGAQADRAGVEVAPVGLEELGNVEGPLGRVAQARPHVQELAAAGQRAGHRLRVHGHAGGQVAPGPPYGRAALRRDREADRLAQEPGDVHHVGLRLVDGAQRMPLVQDRPVLALAVRTSHTGSASPIPRSDRAVRFAPVCTTIRLNMGTQPHAG